MVDFSRQHINDLIKKGDLVRDDDSRLDMDNPLNRDYCFERGITMADMIEAEKPKPRKIKKVKKKPGPKPKIRKPQSRTIPLDEGIEAVDAEEVLNRLSSFDIRKLSSGDVAKVARLESALKTRVEREVKRKELIDRDIVRTVFGKIYTIETNELKTIGTKLAAELAGMFETEDPKKMLAVEKKIDNEIAKSLAHIKRVINDFLQKAGAEMVK